MLTLEALDGATGSQDQLPDAIPLGAPAARPGGRRRVRALLTTAIEGRLIFLLAAALYGSCGWYLSVRHSVNFGDALSRVSQARAIEDGHDPHLAAIGFVYGPVPPMLLLPFLPLQHLLPALVHRGLIGNVESILFMAGGVRLVASLLRDAGLHRTGRLLFAAVFAAHPLLLYYGGSGMSEPCEVFFLLLATSRLVRWLRGGERAYLHLGVAGTAVGLAYLTRLESVAAIPSVIAFVFLVAIVRSVGRPTARVRAAALDAALIGLPAISLVTVWALASKIITGDWIGYVSSNYGAISERNTSSQGIFDRIGATQTARFHYVVTQVGGLEPLILVALGLVILVAAGRRSWLPLVPLATMGPVLFITSATLIKGSTFGFLRFAVTTIPLTVVATALSVTVATSVARDRRRVLRISAGVARMGAVLAGVALCAVAIPSSADELLNTHLASQEAPALTALLRPGEATKSDRDAIHAEATEREVAARLDSMHLPSASVLCDTGSAFAILLATSRPKVFVTTPDRDFHRVLADPARFGVRYLLVPNPGAVTFDALETMYPGLFDNGGGIGQLAQDFPQIGDGAEWKLFRVVGLSQG